MKRREEERLEITKERDERRGRRQGGGEASEGETFEDCLRRTEMRVVQHDARCLSTSPSF